MKQQQSPSCIQIICIVNNNLLCFNSFNNAPATTKPELSIPQ